MIIRPARSALFFTTSLCGFAAAPASAEESLDETDEIVVNGMRDTNGYKVDAAASATKIDAPLRDIPQTVNVVGVTCMNVLCLFRRFCYRKDRSSQFLFALAGQGAVQELVEKTLPGSFTS